MKLIYFRRPEEKVHDRLGQDLLAHWWFLKKTALFLCLFFSDPFCSPVKIKTALESVSFLVEFHETLFR